MRTTSELDHNYIDLDDRMQVCIHMAYWNWQLQSLLLSNGEVILIVKIRSSLGSPLSPTVFVYCLMSMLMLSPSFSLQAGTRWAAARWDHHDHFKLHQCPFLSNVMNRTAWITSSSHMQTTLAYLSY